MDFFLFVTVSGPALWRTQSPIQWISWSVTPEIKWPGHEADHSPTSSTEVKNAWSYTSIRPYIFMVWYLYKLADNFTFYRQTQKWVTCLSVKCKAQVVDAEILYSGLQYQSADSNCLSCSESPTRALERTSIKQPIRDHVPCNAEWFPWCKRQRNENKFWVLSYFATDSQSGSALSPSVSRDQILAVVRQLRDG